VLGAAAGWTLGRAAPSAAWRWTSPRNQGKPPNVVLVVTDDQGYGDLGCHGNPILRTPNLDALYRQSVRLTDFHVGPTCAPTRASLMTGRYCNRTGVWHTIMGRSLLRRDEVTMADVFAAGGYRTGIFGKWHLGDNYPFRPQDRGFHEVLVHGGGGVGQTPDTWGNDYFDDTYLHNGTPEKFSGYCTDVWFDGAMRFIEANRDRPFFAYLATNAPHSPYNVSERYSRPLQGQGRPERQLLRHGREHRREHGPAAGRAQVAGSRREHDPDLHDGQRDRRGLPARQRLQRRHARDQGQRVRRRPSRAVLRPLAGRGARRRQGREPPDVAHRSAADADRAVQIAQLRPE
jgi:arylsulfatase A-like enzyme